MSDQCTPTNPAGLNINILKAPPLTVSLFKFQRFLNVSQPLSGLLKSLFFCMQSGCSVQKQLLRFGGKLNQFTRPYLTCLITHITFLVVLTVLSSDFFLQVELHGSLIQHFIKCSV